MKLEKLKGKFITFEGGEGGGKTTQSKLLVDFLIDNSIEAIWTREPGGCPEAEEIRNFIVNGKSNKFDDITELLLLYASRYVHTEKKIKPALEKGNVVVSDRYFDSTLAYQGFGGSVDKNMVEKVREAILGNFKPDLTLIFDIDVETGLKRAFKRGETNRFEEKTLEYHKRVREGFIEIAKNNPDRCVLIDVNDLEVPAVEIKVREIIKDFFNL